MALFFVPLVAIGCSSDHHVSPWGAEGRPTLTPFAAKPDLAGKLAIVDREAKEAGLTLVLETKGHLKNGHGDVIVRAYEGKDALGRVTHAVRAATALGVVMAIGPLEVKESRATATELVPSLESETFRAATDMTGDGTPDVILRNDAGEIEIWQLGDLGSNRYEVDLAVQATQAGDVDSDGKLDVGGAITWPEDDPIGGRFPDTATFDGVRFSSRADSAVALHERALAALDKLVAMPGDVTRLRRALERAWHSILAGRPRDEVLKALDKEPVPAALKASFEAHDKVVHALPSRPSPTPVSP